MKSKQAETDMAIQAAELVKVSQSKDNSPGPVPGIGHKQPAVRLRSLLFSIYNHNNKWVSHVSYRFGRRYCECFFQKAKGKVYLC